MSGPKRKPKIERGYDFSGKPIARVTFDLKAADVSEQIDRFFKELPSEDDDDAEQVSA